jgi:hypothetical protein
MKRHCSLAIKAKERKATKKRGEGITEKPLETQNRKQKKKKKHRDEQQQEKRRGRPPSPGCRPPSPSTIVFVCVFVFQ